MREKGTKKAKVGLCEKGGYTALQLQCESPRLRRIPPTHPVTNNHSS